MRRGGLVAAPGIESVHRGLSERPRGPPRGRGQAAGRRFRFQQAGALLFLGADRVLLPVPRRLLQAVVRRAVLVLLRLRP